MTTRRNPIVDDEITSLLCGSESGSDSGTDEIIRHLRLLGVDRISGRPKTHVFTKEELCCVLRSTNSLIQSRRGESLPPGSAVSVCQATTQAGKVCSRVATSAVSLDLRRAADHIPVEIFGEGIKEKLRDFSHRCCFFCWQHAVRTIGYYTTYTIPSYVVYYVVHPGEFLDIFFRDVQAQVFDEDKHGNVTRVRPRLSIGDGRSERDIFTRLLRLATAAGLSMGVVGPAVTEAYREYQLYIWALISIVFYFQYIRDALTTFVSERHFNSESFLNAAKYAANVLVSDSVFLSEIPSPPPTSS